MDNGLLTWYNLDLPETIEVRDSVYNESGRISTIACSVLDKAYVCMETLCPLFVKKEGIEKSIKATGATFTWGADKFEDLKDIAVGFKKVGQFLYGNLPLFLVK